MSESDIIKQEQPNPDDILAAIQSFNDPNIIINLFQELGWNYSTEVKETLMMVRQNANLSIKFKALKHLRELLREAAEAAGYVANVSSTVPNPAGGSTTFSAKRISGILNPAKKINSTELKGPQNDQIEESKIESNRGCNREQSQDETIRGGFSENNDRNQKRGDKNGTTGGATSSSPGTDTRCAFPIGDAESGGTEPTDGGETIGRPQTIDSAGIDADGEANPCIKTRPPTCDHDLYPGISSAEE